MLAPTYVSYFDCKGLNIAGLWDLPNLTMESMIPKLGPKVLESVFSFPGPQSANLPLFHIYGK